jgi:hypothetical protein
MIAGLKLARHVGLYRHDLDQVLCQVLEQLASRVAVPRIEHQQCDLYVLLYDGVRMRAVREMVREHRQKLSEYGEDIMVAAAASLFGIEIEVYQWHGGAIGVQVTRAV